MKAADLIGCLFYWRVFRNKPNREEVFDLT